MDETSARRGQDYVSLFMDLVAQRVLFATDGRDAATVAAFAADLQAHGGEPKTRVGRVCADMSPAFIKASASIRANPTATGRRSCSTGITWLPRPTRPSTPSAGPRPRPVRNSNAAVTPG